MRPIVVVVGGLAGASANAICLSQTPTSGTALTLNGALVSSGVAVLDKPRRVLVTYGVEASSRTLAFVGTNWSGAAISETVTIPSGGGGTVATVLDYATVTSITPAGGGFSAALTVGTNGVASSAWIRLDQYLTDSTLTGQFVVSGTVNFTVQGTLDDPNSPTNPVTPDQVTWFSLTPAALVTATTSQLATITPVPTFIRVQLNSGTGTVTATVNQYSMVNG